MTCSYCSAELPDRAMFCGECGRTVQASTGLPPRPVAAQPLTVPAPPPEPGRALAQPGAQQATCDQCAAPLDADDIFCGECGFVSRAIAREFIDNRQTSAIRMPDAQPPAAPAPAAAPEPTAAPTAPIPPAESAAPAAGGQSYVLQFSTGESVRVSGSGLIGRNPRPEPGEYVDELVRVLDPARTVSKTHLEFGQDSGTFWVLDRFSGNGTVLREPDAVPQRLSPDRRYHLVRGSRVEIGEQFFIVS